jgi:hypothetical protein
MGKKMKLIKNIVPLAIFIVGLVVIVSGTAPVLSRVEYENLEKQRLQDDKDAVRAAAKKTAQQLFALGFTGDPDNGRRPTTAEIQAAWAELIDELDDDKDAARKAAEKNVDTSTPNLYELTRQTAENTRHIFWLIAVCFAAWSFRSYKTGK